MLEISKLLLRDPFTFKLCSPAITLHWVGIASVELSKMVKNQSRKFYLVRKIAIGKVAESKWWVFQWHRVSWICNAETQLYIKTSQCPIISILKLLLLINSGGVWYKFNFFKCSLTWLTRTNIGLFSMIYLIINLYFDLFCVIITLVIRTNVFFRENNTHNLSVFKEELGKINWAQMPGLMIHLALMKSLLKSML